MFAKNRKAALVIAAAAMLASSAGSALAGSATANLSVSATVTQNCTVSTTALNFGAYDPVSTNASAGADKTGSGTVVVTCTKNSSSVTIGMGLGANQVAGVRKMLGGTNANLLTYELYQPTATTPAAACSSATVWGTAGGALLTPTGISGWGATVPKTFNVCGTIPKGQDVSGTSAGESYTDTVVSTVNF